MPRGMKKDPGNFIIIEHAPGEYTELRHLMKGSVRVAVGARVTRGQEIARCGNSGNARTPHLHIGFLGSIDPIATRPMRFSRYQVLSPSKTWTPGDGVPKDHQILRPTP
jgi:murein DD-endopeptidase MepM/ murein hydrolase activator NlpD